MHHCWLYISSLFFHATGMPFWLLRSVWPLLVLDSTLNSFCCFLLPGFFDFFVAAVELRIWETVLPTNIFYLYTPPLLMVHAPQQPAFINVPLEVDSSTLMKPGILHSVARNAVLTHLSIIQQSANYMFRKSFI